MRMSCVLPTQPRSTLDSELQASVSEGVALELQKQVRAHENVVEFTRQTPVGRRATGLSRLVDAKPSEFSCGGVRKRYVWVLLTRGPGLLCPAGP